MKINLCAIAAITALAFSLPATAKNTPGAGTGKASSGTQGQGDKGVVLGPGGTGW